MSPETILRQLAERTFFIPNNMKFGSKYTWCKYVVMRAKDAGELKNVTLAGFLYKTDAEAFRQLKIEEFIKENSP